MTRQRQRQRLGHEQTKVRRYWRLDAWTGGLVWCVCVCVRERERERERERVGVGTCVCREVKWRMEPGVDS
jgi:hypothetical protein